MSAGPGTVDSAFVETARRAGTAIHMVLPDGRRITYAETRARACRLASVLARAGIGGGDRVATFMRS